MTWTLWSLVAVGVTCIDLPVGIVMLTTLLLLMG